MFFRSPSLWLGKLYLFMYFFILWSCPNFVLYKYTFKWLGLILNFFEMVTNFTFGRQVHYIEINSNDEPVPGAREQRQQFYSEKQTYAPITGLKPETRYLVQVSAFTRKGDGVRSDPRIITTKGAGTWAFRNYLTLLANKIK